MSENTGWICPKCGAVNAPSVQQCPCSIGSHPRPSLPYVIPMYPHPAPINPYIGDIITYPPNVWYSYVGQS